MQNDKWGLFQKFLITENANISITDFLINSAILIVLGFLLEVTYRKCAGSLSNRRGFASNFILLGFTTMIIIITVKSSVALSLGLVGALSIVRFRAAIKEPEELIYLFIAIALGLVLGANQREIALLGFIVVMGIVWARFFTKPRLGHQNLFLSISTDQPDQITLAAIVELVKETFDGAELKRYDVSPQGLDVSFIIEARDPEKLELFHTKLKEKHSQIQVSFLENTPI